MLHGISVLLHGISVLLHGISVLLHEISVLLHGISVLLHGISALLHGISVLCHQTVCTVVSNFGLDLMCKTSHAIMSRSQECGFDSIIRVTSTLHTATGKHERENLDAWVAAVEACAHATGYDGRKIGPETFPRSGE